LVNGFERVRKTTKAPRDDRSAFKHTHQKRVSGHGVNVIGWDNLQFTRQPFKFARQFVRVHLRGVRIPPATLPNPDKNPVKMKVVIDVFFSFCH
jgi:hypothetical protein